MTCDCDAGLRIENDTLYRCWCALGDQVPDYFGPSDRKKERPIRLIQLPKPKPPAPSGRDLAAGERDE